MSKTHICRLCKKPVRAQFDLCYSCYQREKQRIADDLEYAMRQDALEDIWDEYYSHECSMCGKEGATLQNDTYFCGTCWSVWNS